MSSAGGEIVSVVVCCYNHEHYLREAIESVLAQTYPDVEVIFVDDGSTDRSWDVAQSFAGVRCIRQQNAGTPAATRNRGLRECRGDYVIFLDGDDRLLPNAIEIGVRSLQRHSDCAFAAGRCRAIGNDHRCLTTWPDTDLDHYGALLLWNYILTPGSVIFRRRVVEELGGFDPSPEKKGSDDYDMYLRIAASWPIRYHDEMVLEYREHGSNLSNRPELMLKSTLTVLRAQRTLARQNQAYRKAYSRGMGSWREFYGDQVVESIRNHVRGRKWNKAFNQIQVLLRHCPNLVVKHAFRKVYCVVFRVSSDRLRAH